MTLLRVSLLVRHSADLAGDVAVEVLSPADCSGEAIAGVTSLAIAEVASSVDLAGVATWAVLAEAVPSAIAEVTSLVDLAGVASPAVLAEAVRCPRPLLRWRPRPTLRVLLTPVERLEWSMGTVFRMEYGPRVTVMGFVVTLLMWCPWPMLEGPRLIRCLWPL